MSKKQPAKFITKDILKSSVLGAFRKLDPRYMMKNPVMFVVELGFILTLLLTVLPGIFGDTGDIGRLRLYNGIVCGILLMTVLFANFAEAVAEGRGKAQAASLKKTQKDTDACLLGPDGSETTVSSADLRKDDLVLVRTGETIPGDGEVIEGT
ncbi:MAG: potassium-transporting ATPase subunit B, partial [Pseudoflavonifractor sp.]